MGLDSSNNSTGVTSSTDGDWFASATAAPSPAPAAVSASTSSGFRPTTSGRNMYSSHGVSNPYGGSSSNSRPIETNTGGGGYYGNSTGTSAGYSGSANTMGVAGVGGAGGGGGYASAPAPPASAFGSNPNSGSSNQIGGSNSFEMGTALSGAIGGPIGGPMSTAPTPAANPSPAPHVFDPSSVTSDQTKSNAMTPIDQEDYDNEPPLLEELGVNFPQIYSKSQAVLFPLGKHAKSLESGFIDNDADLAGPLAFALGLGGEMLLSGKLNFGYVYGLSLSGCLAMTLLLNLLNPNGAVSFWTVVSILGYALLPVNLLAAINAIVRVRILGKWGMIASILTILWCTTASARLFERGCNMRAQRFLVAYPTALLYSAFVMITIF